MSVRIKICGMTTPGAAAAARDAGAQMAGFVFYARSPRHVTPEAAREMAASAAGLASVAVTVDAGDTLLDRIFAVLEPDMLQLHGAETPDRVRAVRERYGVPVIKAIGVAAAGDISGARAHGEAADMLLFDASPGAGDNLPGGRGRAFDWSLLSGVAAHPPWILSGGLTPDNVGRALGVSGARWVDVSSGVEDRPGHKDAGLVARFVRAVRTATDVS